MFIGRNRNRRRNTFPKVTGDVIPHANNESPGNEIWMLLTMSTCWAHATRMWSNLTLLDTRRGEFRKNVFETRQLEKRIQYFLSSFFFSPYRRLRLERATFLSPPPCSPFALHNLWPTQKKKRDFSNTRWIILLVPRVWGLTRKWYSGRRWSLLEIRMRVITCFSGNISLHSAEHCTPWKFKAREMTIPIQINHSV